VKPRISWGSGITPPSYLYRYGSPDVQVLVAPNPNIKPQTQQGYDYGLEIYDVKNKFQFEAIYYDNTLKNMFVEDYFPPVPNSPYNFIWTNVASVANRGWEFSGDFNPGPHFSLKATFSIMNSTVKDSTGNYLSIQLNGLAPGSRLVNLPRHTAGVFMTYQFYKLFGKKDHGALSFNITEVDGVYTLDDVRYITDLAYGRTIAGFRDYDSGYWTSTGTVFRLGLNMDYYLIDRLRFFIQGYNIANSNKVEQTSTLATYGASWMFGIKYNMVKGK
jgi:outer membrane receptor protein involved in Fe transport